MHQMNEESERYASFCKVRVGRSIPGPTSIPAGVELPGREIKAGKMIQHP